MPIRWKTHAILSRLEDDLSELELRQQRRRLREVRGINLCSNDYLGLSTDPRLRVTVDQELGVSSTGSRLLSGNHALWESLEPHLASFVGAQASVYFGSGYLANLGVLTSLLQPGATVFSDALNHASIIDGIRLSRAKKVIFPHGDLNYLEGVLKSATGAGERFIVVESIFSMDGDRAPLEDLYKLADRYDAGLIIDEAHATGVVGPGGRGLVAASGRPECVIATVHTCSKAFASVGGFVAGPAILCQHLINNARSFIFSTALPPYIALQTGAALGIVKDADDRRLDLARKSEYLRNELRARRFDIRESNSQIVPVVFGSNKTALNVAERLTGAGFGVKAIRPPTVPKGSARLRLSLTTNVGMEELALLVQSLSEVGV
jgi:8-amino-7-oxononanoate synthase